MQRYLCVFYCFLFLFSTSVLADSTYVAEIAATGDSITVVYPAVIVRPQNSDFELGEYIGSAQLKSRDLKAASGNFDDPARTLALFPGITRINNYRNDLVVNGGAPSENSFIVDGFRIQNINHFGGQTGTGGIISFINPDCISSVQFSAGGFPAQFGDRVSSVSSVYLKSGSLDGFQGRADLSATQFALGLDGPISSNTSFLLSARRSYLDLVFKYSGFIFTPSFYDFLAKIESNLGKSRISFLFLGALDRIILFDTGNDPKYNNPRALGSNQNHFFTGLSFRNHFEKGYFNISLSREIQKYETVPNMLFDNSTNELSNSFHFDFSINLSGVSGLKAGANAKMINYSAAVNMKPFYTTYNEILRVDTLHTDLFFMKAAGYIEYFFTYNKIMTVVMGARADFFDGIHDPVTFSPRFAVQYFATPELTASVNLGLYSQPPEYLYLAAHPANYHLTNIKCRQIEAGFSYYFNSSHSIALWGYHKYYEYYPASTVRPYLVMSNTGADFSGVDDNFNSFGLESLTSRGGGESKGLKLFLRRQKGEGSYQYSIAASYGAAEYFGLDKIPRAGTYDQRWNIVLAGGYFTFSNWAFYSKFRYATGTPYTPYEQNGSQLPDNFNSFRFKDQHSLDIRIEKLIHYTKTKLSLYLDIQNIYNNKVRSSVRWDRKTQKIADDPIMGIIPSIGISLLVGQR